MSEDKALMIPDFLNKLSEQSLADKVINQAKEFFDDLREKRTLVAAGIIFMDGGNISGSVKLGGIVMLKEPVICGVLKAGGYNIFFKIVAVRGESTIAGSTHFRREVIFAGNTEIIGRAKFSRDLVSSQKILFDGNTEVSGTVFSDGKVTIDGRLHCHQMVAENLIVQGRLNTKGNVKTRNFLIEEGGGIIGGDLETETFEVRSRKNASMLVRKNQNLSNPLGLIKYIASKIIRSLSSLNRGPEGFEVRGDVVAKKVEISNTIIHGDLTADEVILHEGVEIYGMINSKKVTGEIRNKLKIKDTDDKKLSEKNN